jgi:N-acetylglucosaminyldiphosphoundecaprenol N-acetyl-beta-D-mannosaminyltransferase
LGVNISAINLQQVVEQISTWIERGERRYVSMCTVHTVMECQYSDVLRQAINHADLATPDGMPLAWPPLRYPRLRLMLALCQLSLNHGIRHYFYLWRDGTCARTAC